jgi:hypothetical protein
LKPLHPVEQLWCETDLCLEHLDESAVAETDTLSDIMHYRGDGPTERVDSKPHDIALHRETGKPCYKHCFQDTELVDRTDRGPEPLAKLAA